MVVPDSVANVLIDLRMVRGQLHGIARYALELACRLPELAPDPPFPPLTPPPRPPPPLRGPTPHPPTPLVRAGGSGPSRRVYYRLIVGPRAKRARALITVSEFSRDEL